MNATLIVGIIIGFIIASVLITIFLVLTFKFDGTINVKYDQNEGPYFFLEVDNPKTIEKSYYVIFKVKTKKK